MEMGARLNGRPNPGGPPLTDELASCMGVPSAVDVDPVRSGFVGRWEKEDAESGSHWPSDSERLADQAPGHPSPPARLSLCRQC